MTLHTVTTAPEPWLGEALERFEAQFTYPLGSSRRFRISHGRSYLPFFRAMGEAVILVAEHAGEVLGTLARVHRKVARHAPGETPTVQDAHYLCDLKVRPSQRGSFVLARLLREAKRQIEQSDTHHCYAVVMNGTGHLPTDYTGRLGIPTFAKLAEISVLRLSSPTANTGSICDLVDSAQLQHAQQTLAPFGYRPITGESEHRSVMPPLHLLVRNSGACGTLEDTRKGKRLFEDTGAEMLSAHLSSFAYLHPEDGADLIRAAVSKAATLGLPAVFVALPSTHTAHLLPHLKELEVLQASASVFGHQFTPGTGWWIDTCEI
jgi:hypothetical protein